MVIGIDTSRAFGEAKTGTENYSYMIVKEMLGLPESRQHRFVLFTRPNAILPSWIKQKNVYIIPINNSYLWTQLGLAWETWREPKLDLLWIPAHTLPVLRRPGLMTAVTIHGLEYKWLPEYKNSLQRWYLPLSTFYAAKSADKLIAVSEFTKNQLKKETRISAKKIKVIHEGVEIHTSSVKDAHTPGVLTKYGLERKKYILFVGTVQPRKNLVTLIEAFSLISRDNPDVRLAIAGGVGWMAETVMQSPARFGVQESVVFTGRVSDEELASLYRGALLYVQPSVTEGFGLPVLEAMLNGVPVIASDGGALPEVIGAGGVIVKLGDSFVKNLAEAIKMVLGSEIEQKRLINMGHKMVNEFSWSKASKETLEFLVG
jgi:glycosyltransferase involved in cell wall biosynthesis